MNWNTVYITGKEGFKNEVLHRLNYSKLSFMPGSVSDDEHVALIWVDERASLRDLKKAIGSKSIFRFRMMFFASLEEATMPTGKSSDELTLQERALVKKMTDWQEEKIRYKHSA